MNIYDDVDPTLNNEAGPQKFENQISRSPAKTVIGNPIRPYTKGM